MAFGFDDPVTWGIIFVVALVLEILIVANMRAHGRTGAGSGRYTAATTAPALRDDEDLTDILSRFVEDEEGNRVGETVGMDGEFVILKDGTTYKAVPRARLVAHEGHFRTTGDVDWTEAEARGAEWRERQHKEITYTSEELPEDERPGAPGQP